MRKVFPDLEEQSPNNVYRLPFRTNAGTVLSLMIRLAPTFPKLAPELYLVPAGPHRLLTSTGQVSNAHPRLANWDPHCDLSQVLRELVEIFRLDPPGFHTSSSASMSMTGGMSYPRPQYPAQPVAQPTPSPFGPPSFPQPPTTTGGGPAPGQPVRRATELLPAIPQSFPELESYSEAELAAMLHDEKMLEALFNQLAIVQQIRKVRDELREKNADLARTNLSLEEAARAKRSELTAKESDLSVRRSLYEAKRREKEEIAQRFSGPAVAQEVAKNLTQLNAQSEELASQYAKGQIDWMTFSEQYLEIRKLYHQRAAMREALLSDKR